MNRDASIIELSDHELDHVVGGVVPVVAAAFISGAKWGASVVIAAAAVYGACQKSG